MRVICFFDDNEMVYYHRKIAYEQIKFIELSLCNEIAFAGLVYVAPKFNDYVDVNIESDKQIDAFQVLWDNHIYQMIDVFLQHDIVIKDCIGVIAILKKYPCTVSLYRDLAKAYCLDNPRKTCSLKERYPAKIQQQFIGFFNKLFK